jgi:hypothetical protein
MNCLTAGASASNATNYAGILQNTAQELENQIIYMNPLQPVVTAQDRRQYIDWLRAFCLNKQREVGIEFNYNIIFENV